MKKFFVILMAVAMMLCSVAIAESTVFDANLEEVVTVDRAAHLTDWEGKWVLVAAYMGEDYIDEFELEGVEAGLIAVPENAIVLEISSILDGSANDPSLGTIVDQGAYLHAHVHDMEGTMTFAEQYGEAEAYEISSAWDEWAYVVRGEMDGDFNLGPAKTHIKGDDETLHWAEITGIEIEDMEEMKYITPTATGHLIICYAEKNLTKEKNNTIGMGYIFERVTE